jgi:proline racemase
MDNLEWRKKALKIWQPPVSWRKITTIEAHSAGEPLRILIDGFPEIKGSTILEFRRYVKENYDFLRTALMWEPRGHADMYGCIITPPENPDSDFGVLFLHNEGYSTMCGHGIIAVTTVAIETGLLPNNISEKMVKIDTPAGLVTAFAKINGKRVESVHFLNVPSFVFAKNEKVDIPGLGEVTFDIAFGGAFYAFVQAEEVGVGLTSDSFRELINKGRIIKHAVMEKFDIVHPFRNDLNFLYGTIFIGPPLEEGSDSRNVCVFADGEVDRCPTGTGVSARMALHYSKGEIGLNQPMVIESIIGSKYIGSVVEVVKYGPYDAVIPRVEGTAHITGKNEFWIDPEDPLKYGFLLR